MNGAKVQYNFDLALISVYIKRRFIFFYLFRFRVYTVRPGRLERSAKAFLL